MCKSPCLLPQRSHPLTRHHRNLPAHSPVAQCLVDEAELTGLSARERELAIKRAKNREAARR